MKKISLIVFLAMASLVSVFAQSYTGDQAKRGYAIFSDKVTFIFDENIYGVRPERVFVTGDFRGWDTHAGSSRRGDADVRLPVELLRLFHLLLRGQQRGADALS